MQLGFDSKAGTFQSDYEGSREIPFKVGNKDFVLKEIDEENVDLAGAYVPRITKLLIISDLFPGLFKNQQKEVEEKQLLAIIVYS